MFSGLVLPHQNAMCRKSCLRDLAEKRGELFQVFLMRSTAIRCPGSPKEPIYFNIGFIMNRGEYWLLDSVIDSTKPMRWLNPSCEDLAAAFNKKHHELSYEHLLSTLMKMFHEGHLCVYEEKSDYLLPYPTPPTELDVIRALSGGDSLYYAVTTKGGELWENLSHPDWCQYSMIGSFENAYITAGNEELTQRLFQLYPLTINPSVKILADSIVWDVEAPWQATYWKALPRGYRVQFQIQTRGREIEQIFDVSYDREWRQLQQWYKPYGE